MIDEAPSIQRKNVDRPAKALLDALRRTPTGFLTDAMGGSGALHYRIKPAINAQAAFCGVALTCDAGPADNLALVAALESVQSGDVLVCTTGSYTGCAVTGDLVLGMARQRRRRRSRSGRCGGHSAGSARRSDFAPASHS